MNSLKEKFKDALEQKNSKTKILIAAGIVGILLILLSEVSFPSAKKETEVTKTDYTAYVNELDDKLNHLISSIDGVGKCEVMITLKSTSENVYAKNIQNSQSESSASQNSEYVLYDGKDGDSPILIQENFPEIEGIAIVCSGGDSIAVRERVIQCVSSLFNISTNRISVSKLSSDNGRK